MTRGSRLADAPRGLFLPRVLARTADRFRRDPWAAQLAVTGLTVAALLALAVSASGLLGRIGRVRLNAGAEATVAVAAANRALALERVLLDERDAAGAADAASLAGARRQFDADALAAARGIGSPRGARLPPRLRSELASLRPAVGAALDDFRRRLPVRPSAGAASAMTGGRGDEVLELPLALLRAIGADATAARLADIRRINRREHAAVGGGSALVVAVLLLLAGTTSGLIAGRERLEAARRRERLQTERLGRAIEGMREGVALFDADGRLVLRNTRFAETAGLTPAATAIGTKLAAIAADFADAEPPVLTAPLPQAFGTAETGRQSLPVEMRVDRRVLEVFRAAMPGGGEILTLTDVTERVEGELKARSAAKLEALGRLTGGVAHDFNNLLQGLTANLEAIAAGGNAAGAASGNNAGAASGNNAGAARGNDPRLDALRDLVDRGTRLTRHLLRFARARPTEAGPLDAGALLGSLHDLLLRTIGDRIELRLALAPDLWPVLADRSGLENAVLNLAINARDAAPDGGIISVTAANHPAGFPGDAEAVIVCVADDGIGMDAEQLRRATEPFFSTKPEGIGTGLGLAMVNDFARSAGGTFTLRSAPGRGTRATLRLPRATAAPPAEGRPARGMPVRGAGETILLVEDDGAVRRAVRSGLELIGYQVVEAGSVDAACRALEDRPVDLVLSDVLLPGSLDPGDLLHAARSGRRDLPVVFNTGDPEAEAARALPLGPRTVLLAKPWRLDEVADVIRSLLDGERVGRGGGAVEDTPHGLPHRRREAWS